MNQWLIDAFAAVGETSRPSDQSLRAFLTSQRSIGARDRRVIADRCFDMLRHRRRDIALIEQAGFDPTNPQYLVWCVDGRAAEPVLTPTDDTQRAALINALNGADSDQLTRAQRLSLPDWLVSEIEPLVDAQTLDALGRALLESGSLDIRVNLEKTSRAALRSKLEEQGIEFETFAKGSDVLNPDALLRVVGHPALDKTPSYQQGLFEVQDAGSQLLARLAAPKRGQTVVDFCAGGGGKTLAMAAMMRNSGNIYACDVSQRRLAGLKPRLLRAGVTTVRPLAIRDEHDPRLDRLLGRADVVMVDAPCSGTGTLRRNPDLKWRVQAGDVVQYTQSQRSILSAAARLVKPGGRLTYATCSLLQCENEAVALAFEATNPGAKRVDLAASSGLGAINRPLPASNCAGFLRIWPHIDQCDGYFVASWQFD